MRLTIVLAGATIALVLVMLLGDRIHIGETAAESQANTLIATTLLTATQGALANTLQSAAPVVLPQSVSGTIDDPDYCGTNTCTWNALLSGDSGNPNGNVTYPTVAGGGATQTDPNANGLTNAAGNLVVDRGLYRVTLTGVNKSVIPLIADVLLIEAPNPNVPGSQVTINVSSIRFDLNAATTESSAFLDNLCSDPSLKTLGCTYDANATNTVPKTLNGCAVPGAGGEVGSACNPLGDSSPAPTATGAFASSTFQNQANPNAPVSP